MRTCYIHIGFHKTGTSSIQKTLFKNRKKLKRLLKLTYFSAGENHNNLISIFSPTPELIYYPRHMGLDTKELRQGYIRSLRKKLQSEILLHQDHDFLISGEDLGDLHSTGVEQFKTFLDPYFDKYKVIAYVRHPYDSVSSVAQQVVKGGNTFDMLIEDTFEQHQDSINLFLDKKRSAWRVKYSMRPRYRYRIEKYQRIFGKSQVHIRDFVPESFPNRSVVDDFFKTFLGLDRLPKVIKIYRVNKSLSQYNTHTLEAINKLFPVYLAGKYNSNRVHFYEGHFASNDSDQKFQFPSFDYKKFGKLIIEDVAWLKQATDGDVNYDLSIMPASATLDSQVKLDEDTVSMLNHIALMEQDERQGRMFINLMSEYDVSNIYRAKQVFSAINFCHKPLVLKMIYQNLRQRKKHEEAYLALKKYLSLKPNERLQKVLENLNRRVQHPYNFDSWFETD